MRKYWIAAILAIVVLVAAPLFWVRRELYGPYYGAQSAETFVDIPHGAGIRAIAAALQSGGVLRHQFPFIFYVRWTGQGRLIKAGEYRFTSPATPVQVMQRLIRGDVYYRMLTIPEGLTAKEIILLMARSGLGDEKKMEILIGRTDWIADLSPAARSLEGFLFPDTYRFSRRTTPEQLLKAMIDQCRTRLKNLLGEKAPAPGWTVADIVILASMVEKEAKTPEERRLVASVLANRLKLKMPLACDPTIIYALKQTGTFSGNLHRADLGLNSPYNTYIHAGLPPGPIANPGVDALRAALAPAESDYLYYVSRNNGSHVFSRDLRSHNLAVDRYQRRRQTGR